MAHVWAIVVAGGSGQRFGHLKQYAVLRDRPVLAWAVEAASRASSGVVLVVPAGSDPNAHRDHGATLIVEGGSTRAESVRHGLAAVPAEADVIIVHDAARPLASDMLFRSVVRAVAQEGVGAAIPGLPVTDTIKVVDAEHAVTSTLDRSALVAVQTPQAFSAALLRQAHATAGEATDDAALVEALGATVRVVPGEARNLKITTPADLRTAEHLLGD